MCSAGSTAGVGRCRPRSSGRPSERSGRRPAQRFQTRAHRRGGATAVIASRSVASGRQIDTMELARRAQEVLDRNRRGDWTCPSASLYPHQWLWDSCFVAIGLARVDAERAAGELRALFRGQWSNGMLPHMLFARDFPDVGSTRIWQSQRNPLAPKDIETSCITQPPVTAIAAWQRRAEIAVGRAHLVSCRGVPEARRVSRVALPRARS